MENRLKIQIFRKIFWIFYSTAPPPTPQHPSSYYNFLIKSKTEAQFISKTIIVVYNF